MLGDDFEVIDKRFRFIMMGNGWVEKLAGGFLWAEGPVYFADGDFLLFSDIPNCRMMRWVPGLGTSVFRADFNNSNGNTRDRQGRLVTCEHGARRVSRTEPDGTITVIADRYEGKRLNSPNDVIVRSDDTIWFTDPPYGILSDYEGHKAESELGRCYVFRVDPRDGSLRIAVDDMVKPNGLAFSPDEKLLYVADSARSHDPAAPHHVRVYDVTAEGRTANGRVFAEINPGSPDGLRLDTDGNVWISAQDGIHCYSPAGDLLGKVKVPEVVANLTFGGPKRNRLFITATTSLYACYVAVAGVQRP